MRNCHQKADAKPYTSSPPRAAVDAEQVKPTVYISNGWHQERPTELGTKTPYLKEATI